MIAKHSTAGTRYSVVEPNGVRHVFASAVPGRGGTLGAQAEDALHAIEAVSEEAGIRGSIVVQSVFLRDHGDLAACRQIMRDFYGNQMPATTYILQPPCEERLLEIEALGVGGGSGEVKIDRLNDRLVTTHHDGVTWAYLADVHPQTPAAAVYDRSLDAFRLSGAALAGGGLRFDQVIRTWLYLGDIVGHEAGAQRYRELNRARAEFYRGLKFGAGRVPPGWQRPFFPASTGIGTLGSDVALSCIALATERPDVLALPLENPQQTSAFDYAHQYGPQSPKFARAMAVVVGADATIFVSGTASITASETQCVDDVEGQARQTLDNIEALVAADNFRRHGVADLGATLDDFALARVYVKRPSDYAKVRAICEARLGEVPITYAIADVCREELLVEIEGIAFSRRRD